MKDNLKNKNKLMIDQKNVMKPHSGMNKQEIKGSYYLKLIYLQIRK
jgi:hypothetical protein